MHAKFKIRKYIISKDDWMIGIIPTPYIAYDNDRWTRKLRIGIAILIFQFELVLWKNK